MGYGGAAEAGTCVQGGDVQGGNVRGGEGTSSLSWRKVEPAWASSLVAAVTPKRQSMSTTRFTSTLWSTMLRDSAAKCPRHSCAAASAFSEDRPEVGVRFDVEQYGYGCIVSPNWVRSSWTAENDSCFLAHPLKKRSNALRVDFSADGLTPCSSINRCVPSEG